MAGVWSLSLPSCLLSLLLLLQLSRSYAGKHAPALQKPKSRKGVVPLANLLYYPQMATRTSCLHLGLLAWLLSLETFLTSWRVKSKPFLIQMVMGTKFRAWCKLSSKLYL